MNDRHLDALLVAGDPVAAAALVGIESDPRALADATRIRAGARPRVRRIVPAARAVVVGAAGALLLVAVLVGLLIVAPGGGDRLDRAGGIDLLEPELRQEAPPWQLRFLDNGTPHGDGWNLAAPGRGQVVAVPLILSFAGPVCDECGPVVADLERLWNDTAMADLAVVGVGAGAEGAVAWWRGQGATFPVAADDDGVGRALGVLGAPATVLIDREGRVAARVDGAVVRADLDRAVRALVSEVRSPGTTPAMIPGAIPSSALSLGVFDATPRVSPPDAVRNGLATIGTYEESVRLALRTESGRTIWVARGPGDMIVMAETRRGGDGVLGWAGTYGGDRAADLARKGGMSISGRDGGAQSVWYGVGIVPDGYTRAQGEGRSTAIRNNAFVFEGGEPIEVVTINGPAGTRQMLLSCWLSDRPRRGSSQGSAQELLPCSAAANLRHPAQQLFRPEPQWPSR